MKTWYVDKEHNAIADTMPYEEGYMLTRINVPKAHRGQGYGSALLQQVLDDADADKTTLYLAIQPSDGLTRTQLAAWYKRHGFRRLANPSALYRRYPQ